MPRVGEFLRAADPWLKFLVWGSTISYLIELSTTDHAAPSPLAYLWIERLVALCFTVEYVLRWIDDAQDHYGWHYPHSALGIIDLVAILPFWLGLFVPLAWVDFLRTMRIFAC